MSDSAAPGDIYNVYEVSDGAGPETRIGEAELDDTGLLTVTGGSADKVAFLSDVFARINAKPTLSKLAGLEPGAERFALGTETVKRDDPAFFDALQTYLTTYYGIRLG